MRHRPSTELPLMDAFSPQKRSPRGHSVMLSVRREQDLGTARGEGSLWPDPPWRGLSRRTGVMSYWRITAGLIKRRPLLSLAVLLVTCYVSALSGFFVHLDRSRLPSLLQREPCHGVGQGLQTATSGSSTAAAQSIKPRGIFSRMLGSPSPQLSFLGWHFCSPGSHADSDDIDIPVHEGCWPDKDDDKIYPQPEAVKNHTELPLWWMAPFFDHTSFGHEAATVILGMLRGNNIKAKQLWAGTTQGDCDYAFDGSMPFQDFKDLNASVERQNKCVPSIVVCHSLPPFWARPKNHWATCQPCPPIGYTASMAIGRAMAETDVYNEEFVRICNRMDEIWVPSKFSLDVLAASGVDKVRLRILPIPVNTTLYQPEHVKPLQLPQGKLVFGGARRLEIKPPSQTTTKNKDKDHTGSSHSKSDSPDDSGVGVDTHQDYHKVQFTNAQVQQVMDALQAHANALKILKGVNKGSSQNDWQWGRSGVEQAQAATAPEIKLPVVNVTALDGLAPYGTAPEADGGRPVRSRPFTFVSCFKWEMRKGWDVLLSAYLQEFTARDNVELYILTKPFLKQGDFAAEMRAWVVEHLKFSDAQLALLPTMYVISGHVSQDEYSGLYKSADAFVIASRGEGWGMPISEAMAMGLPVVATNWSGIADFVDEQTGYPVEYDLGKVPDDQPWWFRGARWANPRVGHLRLRLREVVDNPHTAAVKGKRARELMEEKYTPEVVGQLLAKEYQRVKTMVESKEGCAYCHGKKWTAPPSDFKPQLYTGKEPFIRDPNAPVDEDEEDPAEAIEVTDGSNVNGASVIVVDFDHGHMEVHKHKVDVQHGTIDRATTLIDNLR